MDTLTTIEAVEKTPSGAYKITFLGDIIAGTFDESVGELAIEAKKMDAPVGVRVSKRQGGRLFVDFLELVEAPPELGGPETTRTSDDAAMMEAVAPGADTLHPEEPTAESTDNVKTTYTQITLESGLVLTGNDLEAIADQLLGGMIPIEQA